MKTLTLIATALFATACSSESDEVTVREGSGSGSETVGAEIARDYNRQMDRARNVELQLDEHKRDLDAAIERQTDPQR